MKKTKPPPALVCIVEHQPRITDGILRPTVTAFRPMPWWMRIWDVIKRRKELKITPEFSIAQLQTIPMVYGIDVHPYVLHTILRPQRVIKGVQIMFNPGTRQIVLTPTEETIRQAFESVEGNTDTAWT